MGTILKIFSFLKNNILITALIIIAALGLAVYLLTGKVIRQGKEITRISTNFQQIQQSQTQTLNLTRDELQDAINQKTELGLKVDSLLKVAKTKPKEAKEITIIKTAYRDTGLVHPVIGPVKPVVSGYQIPVTYFSDCWSMIGQIETVDPKASFNILQRGSINEADLIIAEKRRWIFWKRRSFKVFAKCGEIKVTKVTVNK